MDKSAGASAADSSKLLYINNASVNAKLMAAVREGATQVPEIFIEPDQRQCVSNMDLEGGGSELSMKLNSGSIWEAGDLDIPVLDFALLETRATAAAERNWWQLPRKLARVGDSSKSRTMELIPPSLPTAWRSLRGCLVYHWTGRRDATVSLGRPLATERTHGSIRK